VRQIALRLGVSERHCYRCVGKLKRYGLLKRKIEIRKELTLRRDLTAIELVEALNRLVPTRRAEKLVTSSFQRPV